MTKKTYDTEDWKLSCWLDFHPKSHTEECDYCHGNKTVGGGFKSIDGAVECPQCFGSGFLTKPPKTQKPDIPPELKEHLRRAWFDYFNA